MIGVVVSSSADAVFVVRIAAIIPVSVRSVGGRGFGVCLCMLVFCLCFGVFVWFVESG